MGLFGNGFGGGFGNSFERNIEKKILNSVSDAILGSSSGKSRQTEEYISEAKRYIRDGKAIYEDAYNEVSSYATDTEYKLRQHFEYKNQIAKELGTDVSNTLRKFHNFNIDAKIINTPSISSFDKVGDIKISKSLMSGCVPGFEMPSLFDIYDYYEARSQRDEAKQYKVRMQTESDKLYRRKEQMKEIQIFINAEKKELDSLMEKVNKMTKELNMGMSKNSFSKDEADYLKGIQKIIECVVSLLSTQFLTDSLSINQKYQQVFAEIKTINQNLPYAPSVRDITSLNIMKKIASGTVVY